MRRTRYVDLPANALPHPLLLLRLGNAAHFGYFADKFVSWYAAKPPISAQNLDVRIANSCQPYAH